MRCLPCHDCVPFVCKQNREPQPSLFCPTPKLTAATSRLSCWQTRCRAGSQNLRQEVSRDLLSWWRSVEPRRHHSCRTVLTRTITVSFPPRCRTSEALLATWHLPDVPGAKETFMSALQRGRLVLATTSCIASHAHPKVNTASPCERSVRRLTSHTCAVAVHSQVTCDLAQEQ